MPIIKSAVKRAKQTIKRRDRNVGIKQDIKNATKAFIAKPTSVNLSVAQSELDTAVKKGLLKKNTVARRKSQLHAIAKKAGVKLTPAPTKTAPIKPVAKSTSKTAKKTSTKPAVKKSTVAKKPATKKSAK